MLEHWKKRRKKTERERGKERETTTKNREAIGSEQIRDRDARKKQGCCFCPDLIGYIAGVYRLLGNDIPVPRSVFLEEEPRVDKRDIDRCHPIHKISDRSTDDNRYSWPSLFIFNFFCNVTLIVSMYVIHRIHFLFLHLYVISVERFLQLKILEDIICNKNIEAENFEYMSDLSFYRFY